MNGPMMSHCGRTTKRPTNASTPMMNSVRIKVPTRPSAAVDLAIEHVVLLDT